jgi:hypothetical protein
MNRARNSKRNLSWGARPCNPSNMTCIRMELFHESVASPLASAVAARSEHALLVIEDLFKVTLDNSRKYRAFLDYESLVKLVHECGGDVGDWLHSRNTSKAMSSVLHTHFLEQFKTFTSKVDPATGRLRHCGSAADNQLKCPMRVLSNGS